MNPFRFRDFDQIRKQGQCNCRPSPILAATSPFVNKDAAGRLTLINCSKMNVAPDSDAYKIEAEQRIEAIAYEILKSCRFLSHETNFEKDITREGSGK